MDKVMDIQRKGGVATVRFLSGEVVRAPSALFAERRLRPGDEADPGAYRAFLAMRGYPHALEAAMKFLALRERSQQEVRQRLRRSCYDEESIARAIDNLSAHNLLSDARFAQQWVRSRSRKYGRGRIQQELRLKGITDEGAKRALEEALPEEEEYRRALETGKKLARKFQGDQQKLTQALIRRGYRFSLARRAAQEACRPSD